MSAETHLRLSPRKAFWGLMSLCLLISPTFLGGQVTGKTILPTLFIRLYEAAGLPLTSGKFLLFQEKGRSNQRMSSTRGSRVQVCKGPSSTLRPHRDAWTSWPEKVGT